MCHESYTGVFTPHHFILLVSRVYEHCAPGKLRLSHMKHDLEFKSMFLMTDEMRLDATSVATVRFSIPLFSLFSPTNIFQLFSYRDDRELPS